MNWARGPSHPLAATFYCQLLPVYSPSVPRARGWGWGGKVASLEENLLIWAKACPELRDLLPTPPPCLSLFLPKSLLGF